MLKPGLIPAKVTKYSGRVEIARNFDWKWVKVVDNMLVQEGDWIRTRAKSSVEIKQDDGTIIVLRPNTKILFESNGQAKTARGEVRTTKLKLDQGSILSRVQKLAQRDSRFEISTPTATSFIRGTEFRVKVEPEGATRLEVLEGRVDFGDTEQHVSVDGNFGSLVGMQGAMPDQPHQLPAAPASLLAPEDRQVLEGDLANYNFAWASVANAARYHIEVSADSEFKQLVDETWVAGTSAQVQSLDLSDLEPGTYFWRVSALDADGYESAWSQHRALHLPDEPAVTTFALTRASPLLLREGRAFSFGPREVFRSGSRLTPPWEPWRPLLRFSRGGRLPASVPAEEPSGHFAVSAPRGPLRHRQRPMGRALRADATVSGVGFYDTAVARISRLRIVRIRLRSGQVHHAAPTSFSSLFPVRAADSAPLAGPSEPPSSLSCSRIRFSPTSLTPSGSLRYGHSNDDALGGGARAAQAASERGA